VQQRPKYFSESIKSEQSVCGETQRLYVEVAVPVHVSPSFIYRLPPALRPVAQPGARIVVPLGRKHVTGFIVKLHNDLTAVPGLKESNLKDAEEILDAVPLVTPELLELTKWIADYYLSPWGEVIKAALPPGISPAIEDYLSVTEKGISELEQASDEAESPKLQLLRMIVESDVLKLSSVSGSFEKGQAAKLARELEEEGLVRILQRSAGDSIKPKFERRVRLLHGSETGDPAGRKLTESQLRVLEALKGHPSISFTTLLATSGVSASTVMTLKKRNLVEVFEERLRRDPLEGASLPPLEDYVLTDAQKEVLAQVEVPLRGRSYSAFLLHGVTGSGKTEVYIRAMRITLGLGRSAMMLVPEIALTPVFSRRLKMHFGDKVAIFHSSLSRGERE
jgi:primosomal protein N' (replication factor Y)